MFKQLESIPHQMTGIWLAEMTSLVFRSVRGDTACDQKAFHTRRLQCTCSFLLNLKPFHVWGTPCHCPFFVESGWASRAFWKVERRKEEGNLLRPHSDETICISRPFEAHTLKQEGNSTTVQKGYCATAIYRLRFRRISICLCISQLSSTLLRTVVYCRETVRWNLPGL